MKRIFFLFFILFATYNLCIGQNTVTIQNDEGTYSQGQLIDGNREGKWVKYYQSGKKFIIANYVDGVLNGQVISYYKNGNVQAENDYINGKLNGVSKQYDIKGNPIREISYKDNLIFGNCIYYEDGLIDNERYYKNGVIDGKCKDYKKGKLHMEYTMLPNYERIDVICYDTKTGKKKNCNFF